jgi:hypothetical protein
MWFDKSSKQAFVLPPKTGSVTCRAFLNSVGWKYIPYHHSYPSDLIKQHPNLAEYSIHAFLRDPLTRFESGILFLKRLPFDSVNQLNQCIQNNGLNKTRLDITYDEIVDIFPTFKNYTMLETVFLPQSNWFDAPNVNALDFVNIEAELRRITNNYTAPLKRYNKATDFGRSVITQKVKDFIREQYAADYALIKDRLGKEY